MRRFRRFRAKTKTNRILSLTAPTFTPCHHSLRSVFPRLHRYLFLSRCRSGERQKQPTRRKRELKMLVTSKGKPESTQELVNASIQVLIDALESGHSEVLTSYLKAMAKFYYYSFGNILLIATQKPNATHVVGIRSWNLLGRTRKEPAADRRERCRQPGQCESGWFPSGICVGRSANRRQRASSA